MRNKVNRVKKGVNDLATKAPHLIPECDGWDPSTVSWGSHQKQFWICPKGHRYEAIVKDRTNKGSGCPYCSGRLVRPGENDLATMAPHLIPECDGWSAATVTYQSAQRKPWICSRGHRWQAVVHSRSRGKGCPYCCNVSILRGFNDFLTTHPQLAESCIDNPMWFTYGSTQKPRWFCDRCENVYRMTPHQRVRGQGCPNCNFGGFNPSHPGVLYLLRKDNLHKIGITNEGKERLTVHKRNGWQLLDSISFEDGGKAFHFEQNLMRMLQEVGIPFGAVDEKFDGYTETWETQDLEVSSIRDLVEQTREILVSIGGQ